jgi:hypothetical protein
MRVRRQLGQLKPANTSAASLFTPGAAKEYRIYSIHITNVGAGSANASVFHDEDGSTYDTTTALMYVFPIAVGEYKQLDFPEGLCGYKAASSVGVQSSVANTLTFTCYGEIIGEEV